MSAGYPLAADLGSLGAGSGFGAGARPQAAGVSCVPLNEFCTQLPPF